ncbi:hypothetical protein D3C80_1663450 [compost metagenome]
MPEAVGLNIVKTTVFRQVSAFGDGWIKRIAGSRGQYDVGRLLVLGPVIALVHALQQADMVQFAAAEGMNRSCQLGETLHVAAFFEMGAIDARWKANGFSAINATGAVNQTLKCGDDILELAAAPVKTIDARINQQTLLEEAVQK